MTPCSIISYHRELEGSGDEQGSSTVQEEDMAVAFCSVLLVVLVSGYILARSMNACCD